MEQVAIVISAIGTILLGWFNYNQYTRNKITDMKVETLKNQKKEVQKRINTDISRIYQQLGYLLHELKASRVIILQPHPLHKQAFISITFEACMPGVSSVKHLMQDADIANFSKICGDLATRDFIFFKNIRECTDKRFLATTQTNGVDSLMAKRLTDEVHDWTGTLFVDWSDKQFDGNLDFAKGHINNIAGNIQYILPEIS